MTDDDDRVPGADNVSGVTLDDIRVYLRLHRNPTSGITENAHHRSFGDGLRFETRWPSYSDGFWMNYDERARFLKRWFDFPDLGKQGWAIIFQVYPPPGPDSEYFLGWVPPEREADADRWIALMNNESQALVRAAATAKAAGPR